MKVSIDSLKHATGPTSKAASCTDFPVCAASASAAAALSFPVTSQKELVDAAHQVYRLTASPLTSRTTSKASTAKNYPGVSVYLGHRTISHVRTSIRAALGRTGSASKLAPVFAQTSGWSLQIWLHAALKAPGAPLIWFGATFSSIAMILCYTALESARES